MNQMEQAEFMNVINGFTQEQKELVIHMMDSAMLWNELICRFNEAEQKISALKEVMR